MYYNDFSGSRRSTFFLLHTETNATGRFENNTLHTRYMTPWAIYQRAIPTSGSMSALTALAPLPLSGGINRAIFDMFHRSVAGGMRKSQRRRQKGHDEYTRPHIAWRETLRIRFA